MAVSLHLHHVFLVPVTDAQFQRLTVHQYTTKLNLRRHAKLTRKTDAKQN
jgi:hypothetical protein